MHDFNFHANLRSFEERILFVNAVVPAVCSTRQFRAVGKVNGSGVCNAKCIAPPPGFDSIPAAIADSTTQSKLVTTSCTSELVRIP